MLQQYNQIFPGCAERIVQMAESQASHRQDLERTVIHGNIRAERLGQIFAFIIAMSAIVGGVVLIMFGRDVEGLVAILAALGSLAGVFIYGRWRQERERDKKRREADRQMELPFPRGR